MTSRLMVCYEDHDLLVVNKPAGLVCHPTKPDGFSSLISQVRTYLGPDGFAHFINRLDRETSGLVLIARHAAAERCLRQLWESRRVRKEYLAIAHGRMAGSGTIDAPLGPDQASRVAVKDCVRSDGRPARTAFQLERSFRRGSQEFSLVRVWPVTGRKHQIRIHLAHQGNPIVGDKLYGGDEGCYLALSQSGLTDAQRSWLGLPFQALHAGRLWLPWRGDLWRFQAEPEDWFKRFLSC